MSLHKYSVKAANDAAATKPGSGNSSRIEWWLMAWDVTIVILVAINLGLIIFDSLFSLEPISNFLHRVWPAGHALYDQAIHQNFFQIDLAFVGIFILDVLLGWSVAVARKRHDKWWFYPFVHWYDILGCIPLAGFRFLRILRVIALMIRLQRLGIIQMQNWPIVGTLKKYYGIVIEEVSDRVVENVLTSVQAEVRDGGAKLPARVAAEIIRPRQNDLVRALASRTGNATNDIYDKNRDAAKAFIREVVHRAVDKNTAARGIDKLPVIGPQLNQAIDASLADTVCDIIDEIIGSLKSAEFETLVEQVVDSALTDFLLTEGQGAGEETVKQVLIEVIDLLKQQVRVQRWKQADT